MDTAEEIVGEKLDNGEVGQGVGEEGLGDQHKVDQHLGEGRR